MPGSWTGDGNSLFFEVTSGVGGSHRPQKAPHLPYLSAPTGSYRKKALIRIVAGGSSSRLLQVAPIGYLPERAPHQLAQSSATPFNQIRRRRLNI